jgi:hypothetical protein
MLYKNLGIVSCLVVLHRTRLAAPSSLHNEHLKSQS